MGNATPLSSLTVNNAGTTQLNGDVTTTTGQTYNSTVAILGDRTLTGDELNFGQNVSGTGNLTLQPFTVSQAIAIGGIYSDDNSILDLTSTDISFLQNGFSSITIGRTDSSSAITLDGNVTFGDPLTLRSPTGTINVNGVTGEDNASITFDGKTNLNGNITTNNSAINFEKTVSLINANLTLNTGDGEITFKDTVTGTSNLTLFAAKTNVANNISTGTGNLAFNSQVNLTGANAKTFTSIGDITFGNTVTGTSDLTLSAATTNVANNIDTGNLQFDSQVNLTGDTPKTFTSTGEITFGNKVTGTSNLTLNATNTNVANDINTTGIQQFNSPVSLTGSGSKVFNAGTGAIAFNNTVTLNSNDLKLIGNEIDFQGNVTGTGNLQLEQGTANTGFSLGGSSNITPGVVDLTATELGLLQNGFNSITIGREDGSGEITIASEGATFRDPVTIQSPQGTLAGNGTITGADNATISLNLGNITSGNITTNNQDFNINGNLNFIADTSFNIGSATLNINGNIGAGSNTLTLTADEINLLSTASVSGNGNLVLQPATPGQNINIAGTTDSDSNSLDLTTSELASLKDGFSTITIGRSDGSGAIAINPVTFNNPVNIQSPNGSITATGKITGAGNAAINLTANKINVGDITTNNQNITLNGNTTLTGNTTLDVGTATINILGSFAAGSNNLTLTANEIDLPATANSFNGEGNLFLQPTTATQNIIVGGASDSGENTLDLTTTDIASLTKGFNAITIGGSDSSGLITINPVKFFDPVTIQSNIGSGAINAIGAITGEDNASITLLANQNINTSNISTAGGDIKITSQNRSITTGDLNSNINGEGNSGNATLSAKGNVTTGDVSSASKAGNAGNVELNSTTGAIATGNINSNTTSGNGGAVALLARDRINAGVINSSSSTGNGGSVTLDPDNNIVVTSINAQGGTNGIGGNVDITTKRNFRATDTFIDSNGINASISTSGGLGSGNITINHGGESFVVGDATTNGTAGSIVTSSTNSILPTQLFTDNFTQGNIQINLSFLSQLTPVEITSALSTNIPNQEAQSPEEQTQEKQTPEEKTTTADIGVTSTNSTQSAIAESKAIDKSEESNTQQFASFLGLTTTGNLTKTEDSQTVLRTVESTTGVKSAIIYVNFAPEKLAARSGSLINITQDSDILRVGVVTGDLLPVYKPVSGATRAKVMAASKEFQSEITDKEKTGSNKYLASSQKLYQWLIAPQEAELRKQGITNLMFVMDGGLRSLPLPALHDGKQFLIEKYSVALLPSFSLTDTTYIGLKDAQVLAMGAEKFTPEQEQSELHAVPLEIPAIINKLKRGKYFLNQDFTLANLKAQRATTPYKVIHLATHADFSSQASAGQNKSYIQLYDSKLQLNQIDQLGWKNPPVELLVLSACKSAVGDEQAELGFAGLAVKSGVKSAIASLWYVSDPATLGLMTELYSNLTTARIKAEALQQAQLAMLQGKVRIEGHRFIGSQGSIQLSSKQAEYLQNNIQGKLSHPFYWAAFTMIGSPW
ncbi:hypothetical protein NIES4074_28650 [Cylindrospermum sp. NIES-4074]|nr:hypothetical protein NIES4074_28650 [Cylindrospermum sp. NIES-4074]